MKLCYQLWIPSIDAKYPIRVSDDPKRFRASTDMLKCEWYIVKVVEMRRKLTKEESQTLLND